VVRELREVVYFGGRGRGSGAPGLRDRLADRGARSRRRRDPPLLEEGVVADAADVDTALLLGAGWPFWLGGITKFLDQTGRSERMFGRPLAEIHQAAPTA
jgi:hypothetical protein